MGFIGHHVEISKTLAFAWYFRTLFASCTALELRALSSYFLVPLFCQDAHERHLLSDLDIIMIHKQRQTHTFIGVHCSSSQLEDLCRAMRNSALE